MDFYETVLEVLRKDERFFAEDGAFLRNAVYEAAMQMDADLIKLLLENEDTKRRFFKEVDGIQIFDKVGFGWVINNRQFLPDSYTRYKNKIGLMSENGSLISKGNDVQLVFPYKDCILEGGQTKEDQKRPEVFYNETLAPDEIDHLLYPKVLTKAKRFSYDGEVDIMGNPIMDKGETKEEATNSFSEQDNLVIKGNNLLGISSLLEKYEGKIKCIYIDPPFNTDKDSFKYNDKFSRSTWLAFMKTRLLIAKRLLSKDGLIYIHIDYNQAHYLKVLCDELLGEENFINEIIWAYRIQGISKNAWPKKHDTILLYSKSSSDYRFYSEKEIIKYEKPFIDTQAIPPDLTKLSDNERKEIIESIKGSKPLKDKYKEKLFNSYYSEVYVRDVWDQDATKPMISGSKEFRDFRTQKPEGLLKRIIESATKEGEIVLDFFAGSGTTAATALKLNRRFKTIEQMDSQIEIIVERLKDVISGEQEGISKDVNWCGGGSFVYCELAKLNQNYVDIIEKASDDKELGSIFDSIMQSGFISYKIKPSIIDEEAEGFDALSKDDKKRFLMEILDKNLLYVNLCDIDDEEFAVSEEDKAFTRSFYGEE